MTSADKISSDLLQLQCAAVTAAANGIVITKSDGTIVWANPAFSAMSGYSLAEAAGRNPRDLVKSGQEEPVVYVQMWKTILAGRTWHGELVNRRKDGTHYPESLTITPVRGASGHIDHFIAIKQDLSVGKQAQETLGASELRYRRLFESAKDGILILDADTGMIVDVNPFLINLLGFSREQFLGKNIWELGFFRDIVANQESFSELQRNEYIRYEDKPLETADGRRVDVEFVSNVYLVGNQKVIQCNIRDITSRKTAERRLREQNEILANSHEGVMVVDLAGTVSLWNRGAEEMFGWPAAEALGRRPEDLLGMGDASGRVMLRGALEHAASWNGELPAQARDGRAITIDCRVTLVADEAGKPRAQLWFVADITEKKQRERIGLRTQRLEAIGTLSSGIAHDLNNILAPILMAADLLHRGAKDQRQIGLLKLIEDSTRRAAAIIRQLLTFSRGIDGDRTVLQFRQLIREMAVIVRETFPRNITLMEEMPSDLWPLLADATQLHQVLLNLCVNARDAMPDGGVLTLAARNIPLVEKIPGIGGEARAGPHVLLTVSDSGLGISRETLDRIFEPFFTTKELGRGTGLGLSTVMGIVRSHGGFVIASSELGLGSSFKVYLPALPEGVVAPAVAVQEPPAVGNSETILVVDDEAAVVETIRLCLEEAGYRVLSAKDGRDALEVFSTRKFRVKVVVTDVMMPVMDGLELARELRRLDPDVRVIAASGLEQASRSRELGTGLIAEFLAKPFKESALLAAVQRQLEAFEVPAMKPSPAVQS